ncbi:MAG TPA: hypothetical protein VGT60_01230 [Candidatus Limnocylindria bacterium]|nr:hypothetical protein [Candidatus Limnocylindria bacterium]
MYRKIRVEKRIPDGSLWQRFHGYRLGDVHGFARVYLPVGTPWWNPLGGWSPALPASRSTPPAARSSSAAAVSPATDGSPSTSSADLRHLSTMERAVVRRAREGDVRARIAADDPLFDPASLYFALPASAEGPGPIPL